VKRLYSVVSRLTKRWSVQLVLIDDGSKDETYTLLRDCFSPARFPDTTILRHIHNRGIGAAMATGFEVASGDIVCTIDSDCSYDPARLEEMILTLIVSDADIATGSPYHPDGGVDNVPPWRLALSKTASRLYSLLAPSKLHCYTSFFRAYRREWARPDLFESNGFLAVAELLLNASFENARIVEFPVRLGLRTYGQSKMRVLNVMLQHLQLMMSIGYSKWVHGDPEGELGGNATESPLAPNEISGLMEKWVLVDRVRLEV
jgi:dolichol-phosphate mannosyltransferase